MRICRRAFALFVGMLVILSASRALPAQIGGGDVNQTAQVHEIGKDGLKIKGKLTKDDATDTVLKGSPRKVFLVKMSVRQWHVIDLTSDDFDAYLRLEDSSGKRLAEDDDSGGGLNARLIFQAPADGTYRVIATCTDPKPGDFRLSIRIGELTADQKLEVEAKRLTAEALLLHSLGETAKALSCFEQALEIKKKMYPPERFPNGHPDLAVGLNNVGMTLAVLGQGEKALPYIEQTLAMCHKQYPRERFPNGHPDLANSLNSMGLVLDSLEEPGKALTYFEQALEMTKKLYPPGHPSLAIALNNMGFALRNMKHADKALPYCKQALDIYEKQYPRERFPNGDPELANSLSNMGNLLALLGNAEALTYAERALAMYRQHYPPERFKDGHPQLAASLHNMAFALYKLGEPAKALAYYQEGLVLGRKLGNREMEKASESQVLARPGVEPARRNFYLTLAEQVAPSAVSYAPMWHTRGRLLPLLQARHQAVLSQVAQSADLRKDYENLVALRQKISRLQSEVPAEEQAKKSRDKELAGLNDEQDRLERKVAAGLPEFKRLKEMADTGPADLARELPKNAAFVDLIRYGPGEKGKILPPRYVAFVLLPGRDAKFVPLGDAQAIDDTVRAWRKHIDAGENSLAPLKLRELVWDKIAAELPAQTKVVYLCPDGDLARMPFATLPGAKKGTILLEDHALAVVPSGQWLLEQFVYPRQGSKAPDRVLAIGDVAYGKADSTGKTKYQALTGTGREMKRVLEAFGQQPSDGLAGNAANTAAVRAQLKNVRYAHFATHGYFDEKNLSAERKRLKEYMEKWSFEAEFTHRGSPDMRNPAGYVGLVLAGANDPLEAGPDGGVLTGLNVVDLPLEQLRLCVLSACETGLGDLIEAEGVLGLQRAFHAAGCPNVVGSLWKVDDEATAALMTQFYYELRVKKQSPLEALRAAQLTLYRHPESIQALAGSRGKIDQANAMRIGAQPPPTTPGATARMTPVRLWAAFVLSGRGE